MTYDSTFCDAGVRVRLFGADKALKDRLFPYECQADTVDMTLRLERVESLPIPKGELLHDIENTGIVALPNGNRCLFERLPVEGRAAMTVTFSADYNAVTIRQDVHAHHAFLSESERFYLLASRAFDCRVMTLGGLTMHASGLTYGGRAVAFSAPSGGGKTTHTALWKTRFGKKVDILNDDRPALRFEDGKPVMYGTPFSGESPLNKNASAPLHAIVFLKKAAENRMEQLTMPQAYACMLEAVSRPFFDAAQSEQVLQTVEKLITAVPVYQLCANTEPAAAELAEKVLFYKETKTVSMDVLLPLMCERMKEGQPVEFTVTGNSMRPLFADRRDTVRLEQPSGKLQKGDIALYRRADGTLSQHRVIRVLPDSYVMRGDAQNVKEYGIRDEQIIGVVTAFCRKGHRVDCRKNRAYRAYVRLWAALRPLRQPLLLAENRLFGHRSRKK